MKCRTEAQIVHSMYIYIKMYKISEAQCFLRVKTIFYTFITAWKMKLNDWKPAVWRWGFNVFCVWRNVERSRETFRRCGSSFDLTSGLKPYVRGLNERGSRRRHSQRPIPDILGPPELKSRRHADENNRNGNESARKTECRCSKRGKSEEYDAASNAI